MGGSHKHHSCNVYDCPILEMPGEAMKNGRRPFFIAPPGIGIWGAVIYITPVPTTLSGSEARLSHHQMQDSI